MSRLTEQMCANVATSLRGMVTGGFEEPVRRSWADVHAAALRMAGALADLGIGPGTSVAVLAGDPAEVAPLAQAIWLRGASFTMLAQPTPRTDLAVWLADTQRAARTVGAALTVVGAPFDVAAAPLHDAGLSVVGLADLHDGRVIEPVHPSETAIAMHQLTSGSTGTPKAVELTHANIVANAHALFVATDGDAATDVMVSWLPLSHDMGMLAFLTLPMQYGVELVAATPEDFLRRPALWADLIGRYGGTITSGPNFAYAVLAMTLERADDGRFDLSSLRVAINGAEPIDARDTTRLAEAGARFGLRHSALTAAYGMAEATLAITFDNSPDVVVDRVDRAALQERGLATPDGSADACPVVSVGLPVAGMEVRIVDEQARQCAPRRVGSIEVRGAAVSRGYVTVDGWLEGSIRDGWLHTGDLGYLDEIGRLYVCGRTKDVIVVSGRNIYPTDVERAACSVPGVRAGNAVAVRIDAGETREGFAVLAESKLTDDPAATERIRAEVAAAVQRAVGHNARAVLILPPGSVPKTGSGKLQRRKAGELFAQLHGVPA